MQEHVSRTAEGVQRHSGLRLAAIASKANLPWLSNHSRTLRAKVYDVIEGGQGETRGSRIFDITIVSLILLNVAAVVLETVPSIRSEYGHWLSNFELITVGAFTVEYLLRLWTAVEVPFLARMKAWRARLTLAHSPALIIDLLAILPFYLSSFMALDLGMLRVLRLLRFLKLSRYSPAMHTLIRVLQNESRALLGACLLLAMAILFSSTLMYHLENAAQPDKFGSIPEAAWWSIATLTTVGYGDVVPITAMGRVVGGLTMIIGLSILALPVAIISTGFAQELQRRDFVVTWSMMSRVPILSGLEAKQAAEIMPMLQAHNLPANAEVLARGSPGDAMYFVASGKVDHLHAEGKTSYKTGEFFGANAMLENNVHSGSFITTSRTRLLKLHKEDFHRIEIQHPNVADHIRKAVQAGIPIPPQKD